MVVNHARRGRGHPSAPLLFSLLLLAWGGGLHAATSLFDSKRGVAEPAVDGGVAAGDAPDPSLNAGQPMQPLRLDGVLRVGDQYRVQLSLRKGERYRFVWRGEIDSPLPFEGENAAQLTGYALVAADARSVWVRLPEGTGCEWNPEIGIAACEENRVKLSLAARPAPPVVVSKANPAVDGPAGQPPGVPINPFTGKPLQVKQTATGKGSKKRLQFKKSEAQRKIEALRRQYQMANKEALNQRGDETNGQLPPGFSAQQSPFGAKTVPSSSDAEAYEKPAPSQAAVQLQQLREQYRQQSVEAAQNSGSAMFGSGRIPEDQMPRPPE